MLTILDILQRTTAFFESRGVPEAKRNAEYLISAALGLKRLDLFLQFERPLEEAELEKIRPLVRRRANREPLQYILGEWEFHGITLEIDSRVLIPRPETEGLVDRILDKGASGPESILELGTGSGAIALALARALPEARVTAVDRDPGALELAKANARRNQLASRIQIRESDWFSEVDGRFDWIVSNPPYLTEGEWACAEPEVREHEPRAALVAGSEGVTDLLKIIEEGVHHLKTGGWLALETGIAQHTHLEGTARSAGYTEWYGEKDLNQRARYFFARAG